MLSAALYGSEVSHCNKKELSALQTAIADAIGPASAKRAVALVFEVCSTQGEVDPQVCMLSRKVTVLYRVLHKYPRMEIKVTSLLCAYTSLRYKGTKG